MKLLSIETSCDDTAITIMDVKGGLENASFKILANASNSQIKIHAEYGGVYPMLAKKAHIENLPILLEEVLKKSKLTKSPARNAFSIADAGGKKPVDAIAVTYGPGLEPALWTGIVFAKELAEKWNVPLIPVNHMEGHILSVFGKDKGSFKIPKIKTPILSLLVSGGHTELVLTKKWMQYKIIGKTLDDAAGEAFDKVARMMDISYPGGPKISKLAEELRNKTKGKKLLEGLSQADEPRVKISSPNTFAQVRTQSDASQKYIGSDKKFFLPRPMIYSKNFDFSFSGLKTAVLYLIRKIGKLDEEIKSEIALEFENAVVETLIHKTIKAKEKYKAETIIVAGGVACNTHLQREMKKALGKDTTLLFPMKELTGDNSIMIGIAGYLQYIKNKRKAPKISNIKATGNLSF
jgi:N6-L-threonylcarbamoyladenine synthase